MGEHDGAGDGQDVDEGNKRLWEAWKAKNRGTGVRWESESGAEDFLFIMVDNNVVV